MDEIKETCFDHQFNADFATLSSSEYPVVQRMKKLAKENPDDVEIVAENRDGSICVHVPWKWVHIRRPKQMNYTEEQLAEKRERMKALRAKQRLERTT